MEIKYLLSERQTEQLLERISGRMAEDRYSRQTTCSLYCDSPDLLLARLSMDKPVYKEKLRLRRALFFAISGEIHHSFGRIAQFINTYFSLAREIIRHLS